MGRPPHDAHGALERARAQVIETSDAESLRAAQATMLPLLGLSLDMTAEVVGRSRFWVSRSRAKFLRGESMASHGGRRHSLLPKDQELALVMQAVRQANHEYRGSVRDHLRTLVERRSKDVVSDSFLTDLLHRVVGRVLPGAEL